MLATLTLFIRGLSVLIFALRQGTRKLNIMAC